jgi:hypothetical protein
MAEAAELGAIQAQQLAAPGAAIGAVAEAIEHHRQRRPADAVLGQHGGGVGVVVLHREHRQAEPLHQAAGRKIGVQIVRHQHRLDI